VILSACKSSPQWDTARCRHTTSAATHLFFSSDIADINQATRICAECPVAAACLQGALDRHEPCGVWSYTFSQTARSWPTSVPGVDHQSTGRPIPREAETILILRDEHTVRVITQRDRTEPLVMVMFLISAFRMVVRMGFNYTVCLHDTTVSR
jgi:hypothetical protein